MGDEFAFDQDARKEIQLMRKSLMLTAGAMTILGVIAVGALAKGGPGHGGHHGKGCFHGEHHPAGGWHHGKHHLKHKLKKLKKLDTNGDGSVTLEEFLKPKEERFAKLDSEGKGSLSAEQLVAREQAELDYRVRRILKRYDAEAEERITREKFEKPAREHFAMRDFNGDGVISDDELPPRGKRHASSSEVEGPEGEDGPDDEARRAKRRHEGWHHHQHGKGWHGKRHSRNLEDVLKRVNRRFDRLDLNKDGVIDKNELSGNRPAEIAFEQRRRMHVLDTNKDGVVSKEEFLAKSQKRFAMLDLNGDGKITAEDFPPGAARFWEGKADSKQDD